MERYLITYWHDGGFHGILLRTRQMANEYLQLYKELSKASRLYSVTSVDEFNLMQDVRLGLISFKHINTDGSLWYGPDYISA
jgi:hypothetical protein